MMRHSISRGCRLPEIAVALLYFMAVPALADCSMSPGPGMDWSGCVKQAKYLAGRELKDANFERADLSRTNLKEADLTGSNLHKANLTRTVLRAANLEAANLSGAFAMRTYFDNARLSKANLSKAEFVRAEMKAVDLSGADLRGGQFIRADMQGANLDGAKAHYANFSRADLRLTSLVGTELTHAYLYLTNVEGVDLTKVVGLSDEQLELMCGNTETKLPDGMAIPKSWPCANEDKETDKGSDSN